MSNGQATDSSEQNNKDYINPIYFGDKDSVSGITKEQNYVINPIKIKSEELKSTHQKLINPIFLPIRLPQVIIRIPLMIIMIY